MDTRVAADTSTVAEECSVLEKAGVRLVWFDSLGAKSSSIMVKRVLVDPGAAVMQPSFPLDREEKKMLRRKAVEALEEAARKAEMVIITHYHYDHHLKVHDADLSQPGSIYRYARLLVLKNPNKYINESQWGRARSLLSDLLRLHGLSLRDYQVEPVQEDYPDPVEQLVEAHSRNYGDYGERRRELLEKGREWFKRLVRLWNRGPWVREEIVLPTGQRILLTDVFSGECCSVEIRMLGPRFHGVEYDRTGWVTPVLLTSNGYRILFTSDLMGPIIEDYAAEIEKLKPHILILDGPPTYLYPYMFNRINLERAVENAIRVLENTRSLQLVVYDHHLLRDTRWREHVRKVFEAAKKTETPVLTAAECLGQEPLADRLASRKTGSR